MASTSIPSPARGDGRGAVGAGGLHEAEHVVPAARVQPERPLAQFGQQGVHVQQARQRLDLQAHPQRAGIQAQVPFCDAQRGRPGAGLRHGLQFRQVQVRHPARPRGQQRRQIAQRPRAGRPAKVRPGCGAYSARGRASNGTSAASHSGRAAQAAATFAGVGAKVSSKSITTASAPLLRAARSAGGRWPPRSVPRGPRSGHPGRERRGSPAPAARRPAGRARPRPSTRPPARRAAPRPARGRRGGRSGGFTDTTGTD